MTRNKRPLYGVAQTRRSRTPVYLRHASRLAVMLPAPKRFEKTPNSAYLAGRTRTIMARMASAELP